MANSTLLALPAAIALTGAELIYGTQAGSDVKITAAQIQTFVLGNSFTQFSGPTTNVKTFTLPDASATILTTDAAVTVPQGGTGATTLLAHGILLGNGTSAIAALAVGATGTLLAGATGADPAFSATPTLGANGGTGGAVTFKGSTSGSVALQVAAAAGTGTVFQLPATNGTSGWVLQTDGAGVTSWVASSGGAPGGSSLTLQYNNASSFAGMSGTSWDDTNRSLTLTGATVTASKPVLDLSQTWNSAGVTFTGVRLNITNTQSAAGSVLVDAQIAGFSKFNVNSAAALKLNNGTSGTSNQFEIIPGGFQCNFKVANTQAAILSDQGLLSVASLSIGSASSAVTLLTSPTSAVAQHGAADAAAPVAQTVQAQSVVAGTSNTAGVDLAIQGSRGTGTGAGGNIVFKSAPAGTTGTAQNAASAMFTVRSDKTVQLNNSYTVSTLPTVGTAGRIAYVTDAAAPTYLGTLTGGGAVVAPVFDNGSAWVSF